MSSSFGEIDNHDGAMKARVSIDGAPSSEMKDISSTMVPEVKQSSIKEWKFKVYTGLIQKMKCRLFKNSPTEFALMGGNDRVAHRVCYNALKLHHPQLLKQWTSKGYTVMGLVVYNKRICFLLKNNIKHLVR